MRGFFLYQKTVHNSLTNFFHFFCVQFCTFCVRKIIVQLISLSLYAKKERETRQIVVNCVFYKQKQTWFTTVWQVFSILLRAILHILRAQKHRSADFPDPGISECGTTSLGIYNCAHLITWPPYISIESPSQLRDFFFLISNTQLFIL